ncbi:hypothetical protein [Methylobacterium sp. 391_Methyba4]|uniref:hypothetical protein n=1 Tax=Methylobacterium sp. 391_Methyba4 TaxID=3038924 RepID=UPI00241C6ED2|nr:hypothetical protein [Methylobacterium sp. 391_Methyba4]WFS07766.1 hypothetical protein P9K36_00215 [Methylobacterium sp. 391_Methyba4]
MPEPFAYRVTRSKTRGFMAEAKRATEPFEAAHILYEPLHHTVWFAFGETAEAALAAVKAEVLH